MQLLVSVNYSKYEVRNKYCQFVNKFSRNGLSSPTGYDIVIANHRGIDRDDDDKGHVVEKYEIRETAKVSTLTDMNQKRTLARKAVSLL